MTPAGSGREALFHILREIEDDYTVPRMKQLPKLSGLSQQGSPEPFVLVFEGNSWLDAVQGMELREVNNMSFSVTPGAASQSVCNADPTALAACAAHVQVSLFEPADSLLSVELYRLLEEGHLHGLSSIRDASDKRGGTFIVRIVFKNSTSAAVAVQKMPFIDTHHSYSERLRCLFFNTAFSIFTDVEKLEKNWGITTVPGTYQSDMESSCGISRVLSSQAVSEDINSVNSSNVHTELVPALEGNSEPLDLSNPLIGNAPSEEGTPVSRRISLDAPGLRLRREALRSLFEQDGCSDVDVVGGWARWEGVWPDANRQTVVNSVYSVVTTLGGSRGAAHVAVAYLDAFIGSSKVEKDTVYLSGVVLSCAMLGCKQVDVVFPPIKSFLRILTSASRISENEFVHFELHVLFALRFRLQQVTTWEVVETLLQLLGGSAVQEALEMQARERDLKNRSAQAPHIDPTALSNRGAHVDPVHMHLWMQLRRYSSYLCDRILRDTRALNFRPTVLAVAIVAVAAEKVSYSLPYALQRLLPASVVVTMGNQTILEPDDCSLALVESYAAMLESYNGSVTVQVAKLLGAAIDVVREHQ